MQKIARELNLAETAFVLPATREEIAWHACAFLRQQKSWHLPAIPQLALRLCCFKKKLSRETAVSSAWERRWAPSRFELKEASARSYSRMFAPEYGVPEDPATGSSTGPLAVFMIRHHFISKAGGT
jgi:predicted PhzF superfamily epimerase YddE/YHI9